jgi:dipeptidyl aminopeptidase/acylaminoacyl peptidase
MADNDKGFCTLRLCELESGKVGEPMFETPGYDVEFSFSGHLAGTIWSERTKGVIGYNYVTEGPHTAWFVSEYEEKMAAVDDLLPGKSNHVRSMTADESCWLISSESDRAPALYYLYYPAEKKLKSFLSTRPWIDPEKMAPMFPIKYEARDGLLIHGYLTLPLGQKPQNLPLVVMPHGGPWARDVWGYDSLVQMLANRGYAVLQMNYRGSEGYGRAFTKAGQREIGGKIQDDIEDATRWAIKRKLADPKRIAIMGASYGGYSTLFGLGKNPDLYCCGISICGVSDWYSMYKTLDDPEYEFARAHWIEQIGDPEKDEEKLKAISPLYFAGKITAPLLLIHGKDDRVVPIKQAKRMQSALANLGRKPETLYMAGETHGIHREEPRIVMYKAIEAFLAKHLGPREASIADAATSSK